MSQACPGHVGWRGVGVESEMETREVKAEDNFLCSLSTGDQKKSMFYRASLASLVSAPHFLLGLSEKLKAAHCSPRRAAQIRYPPPSAPAAGFSERLCTQTRKFLSTYLLFS